MSGPCLSSFQAWGMHPLAGLCPHHTTLHLNTRARSGTSQFTAEKVRSCLQQGLGESHCPGFLFHIRVRSSPASGQLSMCFQLPSIAGLRYSCSLPGAMERPGACTVRVGVTSEREFSPGGASGRVHHSVCVCVCVCV